MIFIRGKKLWALVCFGGYLDFCSIAWAATINRPAGAVPGGGSEQVSGPRPSAKSKVVPVKRKMDVAVGIARFRPPKLASTTDRPVASKAASKSSPNSSANSAIPPKNDSAALILKDDDTWDSASKRYDRDGAAKSVTGGVRVEDIIEPAFDYQYSGGRRKNPFIPEIVLSGKIARQRELSPNDVEIPIVSPLQSFSLAEWSVIGVWETDSTVWKALIKTPATQGIEAKLGDPIGNSGGRVMSINPDSVIVREFTVRTDGTREYRDVPLHMGSDAPRLGEAAVGGRLILKPGAIRPEILPPESINDAAGESVISTSATIAPGALPGTLKTIESVKIPQGEPVGEIGVNGSNMIPPPNVVRMTEPTSSNVEPRLQPLSPNSGGAQ